MSDVEKPKKIDKRTIEYRNLMLGIDPACAKDLTGRPTTYSDEMAEEICDAIASSPDGVMKLCRSRDHWPAYSTVMLWLSKQKKFSDLYLEARRRQASLVIDGTGDMLNDTEYFVDVNGVKRYDSGTVALAKVKLDFAKWQAEKLSPKLYGASRIEETVDTMKEEVMKHRKQLDELTKKDF